MTTLTEVLSNMRLQEEKESVIQNSINKLNKRFEKYWTPLFKDEEITEKWSNKDKRIHVEVRQGNHSCSLIVKNTTIDKIEILEVYGMESKKVFKTSSDGIYSQILEDLTSKYLQDYFKNTLKETLAPKYFQYNVTNLNKMIAVIEYIFGKESIKRNNNKIIINGYPVDCIDLEFLETYYAYPQTALTKEYFSEDNKAKALETFKVIQKHSKIKTNLPKILNDITTAYVAEVEKYFTKEQSNEVKKQFDTICNKHKIDKYFAPYTKFKNSQITWELDFFQLSFNKDDDYTEFPYNDYSFLKRIKDVTKEEVNKSLAHMENDFLNQMVPNLLNRKADFIKLSTRKSVLRLLNLNKSFLETISYNGENLTLFKKGKCFTLTHGSFEYYQDFNNDGLLEFSKLDNKISDITCYADFEEEVTLEANFLIEFLNS